MFDNPRKELEKLQQELLAAEAEQDAESVQAEEDEDYEVPMEWDDDDREPLSRSYTDPSEDAPIWQPHIHYDEEIPEDTPEKPEKKHYIGLKLAIALELLGIAALFWWWYLWIR